MVKLSKRLQTIADYVPAGSRLADIGSDHALLPVYLAEQGRVSFAVAGEINDGPLEAARRQVKESGLGAVVHPRQGDGLAVIDPDEVDVVTVAGMGGTLIAAILEQGQSKLGSVKRLVLQPNVAEDQVRRWLAAHDWLLDDETVLEEDGKFYFILCAVRRDDAHEENVKLYRPRRIGGGPLLETEELLRFGPIAAERGEEAFFRKWESELEKLDHIMEGMVRAGTDAALSRLEELAAERNRIKEVLECLPKAKP
ncbi:tRNA (adenine(22)-N(1))-methyltransferase TrmK [Paenibacillus hodogayensis]|uniref:tRNA (Adenine(22)-N(1))-methyltransferase TrmK n=1 Tax=Paenibacillus hodogayensis TaxID=279208 RepID=A0ABV5VR86_9BACL